MSDMLEDKLIYLETDEEITAVIDRLRKTIGDEIRFVVPKGAVILQSLVSLKLLKREADRLGKTIAVVTQDPVGLNLGEQADISVYAKPKDNQPVYATKSEPVKAQPVATLDDPSELASHPGKEANTQSAGSATVDPEEESPDGISVHHYTQPVENHPQSARSVPSDVLLKRATRRSWGIPTGLLRVVQILILLGALAAAGYLVFLEFAPHAQVVLALATEPLDQSVVVTAKTAVTEPDFANATIPGRLIEANLDVEKSAPATGKKQVGTKANTTLNLFNYWDANAQAFPAGTKFKSSDGTTFLSLAAVTIPGATTTLREGKVVTTPGKTTVQIEAETAGPDSNGKTGTLTIPSLPQVRQDKIYGETDKATSGGTSKEVTIVSQTDLDGLKTVMQTALTEEGTAKLSESLEGERILDGAMRVTATDEQFSATVGTEAETLVATVAAKAQAVVFLDSQLNEAAVTILKKSIPSARILVLRNSDTLTASTQSLDLATGLLTIQSQIATRTALALDTSEVAETITGRTKVEAQSTLEAMAGVATVSIISRPGWLETLPKRASQIELSVEYQDPPPTE